MEDIDKNKFSKESFVISSGVAASLPACLILSVCLVDEGDHLQTKRKKTRSGLGKCVIIYFEPTSSPELPIYLFCSCRYFILERGCSFVFGQLKLKDRKRRGIFLSHNAITGLLTNTKMVGDNLGLCL